MSLLVTWVSYRTNCVLPVNVCCPLELVSLDDFSLNCRLGISLVWFKVFWAHWAFLNFLNLFRNFCQCERKSNFIDLPSRGAFYLWSFWSLKHTSGECLSSTYHPVFKEDLSGQWFTKLSLCPFTAFWEDSGQNLLTSIFVCVDPNWGKHLCAGKTLRCKVPLS